MKTINRLLTVGIILLSACSVRATTRDSLLDPKSDVVFSISNLSKVGEAAKKTSFGQLWNDPEFQKALGEHDFEKSFKKSMTGNMGEEAAHLYWEELKMLKGFVAFAVNIEDKNLTLVAEISQKDYKRSIAMDRRLAELESKDGEKMVIHKERWQGVDMYGHLYPNNKSSDSWQACIDNTLLMSSSKEWVKKSIAAIKKSPITEKQGGSPQISLRVNIGSIIGSYIAKAEESIKKARENMQTPDGEPLPPQVSPTKVAEALGVTSLKSLSMSVVMNDDNMTIDSSLGIEKPFKGIFKIYDLTPSSTGLQVPFAPAGIINYTVTRMDLAGLWQQLPQIIKDALPPQFAAQANGALIGMPAMIGVDPGRDIFPNLDTQYVSILLDSKPEPEGLYLIRLKNEAAIKTSLQKIFAENGMIRMQLGENFKQVKFRGADIYEIHATNQVQAVAAESGWLTIGSGKAVRQYLQAVDSNNPANKAFYSTALYRQLRKNTPARAFSYAATDIGKYVRVFFQMMLDNPAIKMALTNPQLSNDNPFKNFDINKLPSAKYMAKFFGNAFGYVVPTPKGIKSHSVIYYGNKK